MKITNGFLPIVKFALFLEVKRVMLVSVMLQTRLHVLFQGNLPYS